MTKNIFSVFWILSEKIGGTLISVVSFFIYASLLSPSEIGVATIILAMTMGVGQVVANVFQDPLVCVRRLNIKTLSSIFWGGLGLSLVVASLLFILISIYSSDASFELLAFISIFIIPVLFFNAIYSALLRRRLKFKTLAQRLLVGKLVGACLGIITAFYGFGAFSMVIQALLIEIFGLVALFISYRIRLIRYLCFDDFSMISGSGIPIALRKLSWEGYVKGLPLVIAFYFGASTVGIFAFAWRIIDMPRTALVSGAVSFALPLFSKHDNVTKLTTDYQNLNKITMICFAPLFVGIAIAADPIVMTFFGDKWRDSIPIIQGLAIYSLISFLHVYVPSILTALNVSKVTLDVDMWSTVIAILVFVILIPFLGLNALFVSLLVRTLINYPFSASEVYNRLGISFLEQVLIYRKTIVSITVMVFSISIYKSLFVVEGWVNLIIIIFLGSVFYFIPTYFLSGTYLYQFIRNR